MVYAKRNKITQSQRTFSKRDQRASKLDQGLWQQNILIQKKFGHTSTLFDLL